MNFEKPSLETTKKVQYCQTASKISYNMEKGGIVKMRRQQNCEENNFLKVFHIVSFWK